MPAKTATGVAHTPEPPLSPLPAPTGLPERVTREAVSWFVRLESDTQDNAVHAAWYAWLQAHPDHERAWHQLHAAEARLRALDAQVATATLMGARPPPVARRRRVLAGLALAGAGSLGWLARHEVRRGWHGLQATHRTVVGEHLAITLGDDSRLDLDTDTAISVHFDDARRRVDLWHGRLLVTTAPDPARFARPFTVVTAEARMRAMGTRFIVERRDGQRRLAVLEAAVRLQPVDAPASQAQILHAGEQATFTRTRLERLPAQPLPAQAWTQGMLIARDMRLRAFLGELAPYRRGRLDCTDAVASLPVSGMFPLADTDRILDMLTRVLPVALLRLTPYWVQVRAA